MTIVQGEEPPICRFCLEQQEVNNPLIKACRCSGSVAFVHSSCLVKWAILHPNPELQLRCCICLTNYLCSYSHEEEVIPSEDSTIHLFFTQPMLYIGLTHYFFIFWPILDHTLIPMFYKMYFFVIQYIYFYLLYSNLHIKNKTMYFKALMTWRRTVNIIPYIASSIAIYWTNIISGIFATYLLHYFYNQHIDILKELNYSIIIEFFPYIDDTDLSLEDDSE